MRRATPNSVITPQMYRHFATVTVALTALVAVFANGEKEKALAADAPVQRPAQYTAVPKPSPKPRPSPAAAGATWGNDDDRDFGRPTISVSSSGDGWSSGRFGTELAQRGYSDAYLSQLSAEQRAALAAAATENVGGTPEQQRAQIAAAEAASRLRSGSAGRD